VIFVISGAGGVGKGAIVERLVDADPTLWLSRSWTTRPRRRGEPQDAYVFVDREAFLERLAAGGFLEHTCFPGNGQLYGTPVPESPPGRDVVLEIEVDGAGQVKRRFPDAVVVFVVPPSREEQERRLRSRGDDDEHVRRRLAIAEEEERQGRALADAVVCNDDLERAVGEVAGILRRYRRPPDGG
jgi:guanylate kinase